MFNDVLEFGRNRNKRVVLTLTTIALILFVLPYLNLGSWFTHIIVMVMIYTSLSSAWNLLGGYTGQFSVGNSAFFGIAAYGFGICVAKNFASVPIAIVLGLLLAVALAFIVGFATMRLKGIFFSLTTFALAEILRKLALYHDTLTGGPLGLTVDISGVSKITYYYIALCLMMSIFVFVHFFVQSRFGNFCKAIRENEDAARCSGVNAQIEKIKITIVSAFFTGTAGILYASYISVIEPDIVFSFNMSIKIIILAIVGGSGTLFGPLLGAILIIVPEELIRGYFGGVYAGVSGMAYGIILIITILLRPKGIRGLFDAFIPQKKD